MFIDLEGVGIPLAGQEDQVEGLGEADQENTVDHEESLNVGGDDGVDHQHEGSDKGDGSDFNVEYVQGVFLPAIEQEMDGSQEYGNDGDNIVSHEHPGTNGAGEPERNHHGHSDKRHLVGDLGRKGAQDIAPLLPANVTNILDIEKDLNHDADDDGNFEDQPRRTVEYPQIVVEPIHQMALIKFRS